LFKFFSSQCLHSHQAACTTAYELRSELRITNYEFPFVIFWMISIILQNYLVVNWVEERNPTYRIKIYIYGASQKKVGYGSDKLAVID
jgi:hypothetical protein